jgi:DNA-binding IclR family transcriptional regulator
VTARHDRIGPLLVTVLGVAVLAARPPASAQAHATPSCNKASPQEVIVSATRLADEVLTAKVVQVLKDDLYVFADHIRS